MRLKDSLDNFVIPVIFTRSQTSKLEIIVKNAENIEKSWISQPLIPKYGRYRHFIFSLAILISKMGLFTFPSLLVTSK